MRKRLHAVALVGVDTLRLVLRRRHLEQLTRPGQVLGASAIGEQPVMADAVESRGQHVDQEASDELGYRQGRGLVQIAIFGAVVLTP